MLAKRLAKLVLRGLANIIHRLGYDSRKIGPPLSECLSQELTQTPQAKLKIYNLKSTSIIQRSLPNTLEPKIHPKFYLDIKRQAPSCYVVELLQGRTIGTQGVVLSASDHILQDLAPLIASPTPYHRELYAWQFPKITFLSGRIGLIAGSGGNGYFHWLYDVFPKLALLSQLPQVPQAYIVGYYDQSFVQQSLSTFGLLPSQIIPATHNSHFEAEVLLAPSPSCFTGNPPAWIINFLRKVFLIPNQSNTISAKRIYISRRDASYRKVSNETFLEKLVKDYKFETVTLANKSLKEQAQIFSQADIIISPHGAGLSNLAFCQSGTTVVELFEPNYVNVCYWSISNLINLNYWYFLGNESLSKDSSTANFQSSIEIDLNKFSELLGRIC